MVDHGSVVIENLVRVGFGSPGCGYSFDGEEILGSVRDAVQGAAIVPSMNFLFRGMCLFQRQIWSQPRISIQFRAEFLAARKVAFRQFDGRQLLGFDALGQLTDGFVENRFSQHFIAPIRICSWKPPGSWR